MSPSRGIGTRGGGAAVPPARAEVARAASPATVGSSKSARRGRSMPNASRMRDTTCVARSECPPRSKKLSSAPGRTPSTDSQIPATISSAGVRGGTRVAAAAEASGSGRERRSTLPLGVRGMASIITQRAGTM